MPLFKKRSRAQPSMVGYWLSSEGCAPFGYTRLVDHPDIAGCINLIANIIASTPIRLMQNTDAGDIRLHDEYSRLVDIDPCPGFSNRPLLMNWIVTQMLTDAHGSAYLAPHVARLGGAIDFLQPMPGASRMTVESSAPYDYYVLWKERAYDRTEVCHFRLFSDPDDPFQGRGVRVSLSQLAKSLANAEALKNTLVSPDYKPPLIISVNADSPLSDEEERDAFRESYLEDSSGKPWVLPADLMNIQQIKPLSLSDLAIRDTVELDRKSLCGLLGVPPFLMGLGAFNQAEYNLFIRNRILPICINIENELTHKLLPDRPDCYFKFNRRQLYAYDLASIVNMDLAMADRGYLHGDEVREAAEYDPVGLTEYKVLENYIPYDMSGQQSKLQKEDINAK